MSALTPRYSVTAPQLDGYWPFLSAKVIIRHRLTVARIQQVVANFYEIPTREMTSARRSREVARPRQIAMYLTKELTPKSLPDIGRRFGGRDHTTVIHAIRQIEKLMQVDAELEEDVEALRSLLG